MITRDEALELAARAEAIHLGLWVRTQAIPNLMGQLIVPPDLAADVLALLEQKLSN